MPINNLDYSGSWVRNAIRAIWIRLNQITNTSAVIDPTYFSKNLLGLDITNPQQLANALDQMNFGQPGGGTINGSIAVSPSGTPIIFPTPFTTGTVYVITPYCYDSAGELVDFSIINKSESGFTVYSATNAMFAYQVNILMAGNINGSVSVVTSGTPITFPVEISQPYDILPNCYDGVGLNVSFQITNRTSNGFMVYPAENATFDYQIIIL